jgi:hypothetical protein
MQGGENAKKATAESVLLEAKMRSVSEATMVSHSISFTRRRRALLKPSSIVSTGMSFYTLGYLY